VDADASEVLRYAEDLGNVGPAIVKDARAAVEVATLGTERDAKIFAPVDTGNLRNGIYSSFSGLTGEVGPVADYGHFVEGGTSVNPPQPYMGPATSIHAQVFHEACVAIARRHM
jgi:HK97 gp10 family phage protein